MKQVLQSLQTGGSQVVDIPCPAVGGGQVLVRTSHTLVSAGTERMLLEFGKANIFNKAKQQPEKVRQVIDKIKSDGLMPTLDTVFSKLSQPLAMGYCNVGVVVETGARVMGLRVGERVVSNGKHAEIVAVMNSLCAKVPNSVDDESASFAVLGAIALQGVRLIQPTLGEKVVVIGLGLIGLVTVQLLRANGCQVLGIDFDASRLDLARKFGAQTANPGIGEDPLAVANEFSLGRGVDAVIITASTASNEPVHQAAQMCRKRGRIVLVGVAGLEILRADFYEKELSFQVSCSYGPGRYDKNYEEKGQDYPFGFVRWTAQRNFEAILDLISTGQLDVKPLVSHRFSIEQAKSAYDVVGGAEPSLGILLAYPFIDDKYETQLKKRTLSLSPRVSELKRDRQADKLVVSCIGAGNYASSVLLPAFHKSKVSFRTLACVGGVSGVHIGKKFKFSSATTDTKEVFSDTAISTVVIATRHDSHADFVIDALTANKHVFVEKPLAMSLEQLVRIERAYTSSTNSILMVGFNRRFAPQILKIKSLLDPIHEPKEFIMTINAGSIPSSHWAHDVMEGGGRILGEACHFIDLLRFLAGRVIEKYWVTEPVLSGGSTTIILRFEDGSTGTIHYVTGGHKSFPKERIEVFTAGRVLKLDNYRSLHGYGWPTFNKMNLWRQDKGQESCVAAFVEAAIANTASPINFDEIIEVSKASIEIANEICDRK